MSARPTLPNDAQNGGRTSSFSFLKRTKSNDLLGDRKPSSGRLPQVSAEGSQEGYTTSKVPTAAPKLPDFQSHPQMQTFGGENYQSRAPNSMTSEIYAAPPSSGRDRAVDPYARSESMTHRGRYSYANSAVSTVNSPRRVRRRKELTLYNVLVVGARNAGKTSFLNLLKRDLAVSEDRHAAHQPDQDPSPTATKLVGGFTSHFQEIEMDNERIGLTLWDSQGLEKNVVDLQLREINNFIESKFDETFLEETRVIRSPGYRDTHIHCVFFILDPSRLDENIRAAKQSQDYSSARLGRPARIIGALDEDFDLQVLKTLQGKTTVIPVISKADTVTSAHMTYLKRMVLESLRQADLDPLEALNFEVEDTDDERIDEEDEDSEKEVEVAPKAEPVALDGLSAPATETEETEIAAANDVSPVPTGSIHRKPIASNHKRDISSLSISTAMMDGGYVPLSILSPDEYSLQQGGGPVGRWFPWGFADPYDPGHCDFVKLKEACFRGWRGDLREASREVFYERWRTGRLHRSANGVKSTAAPVRLQPETRKSSGGIPIALGKPNIRY